MGPTIAIDLVSAAQEVVTLLKARRLRLVTAESCTSGLLSAALARCDGAGMVLEGGFVTYTKAQKMQTLGVDPAVLDRLGAVNYAVARAMVKGALERSKADIALAVTGVLGPGPDEDGNPIGLVFICCSRREGPFSVLRLDMAKSEADNLLRITVLQSLSQVVKCISTDTPCHRTIG